MALIILGKAQCPLCEAPIASTQDVIATTPFLEGSHLPWRCADATMHDECFQRWYFRDEFVTAYNQRVGPGRMLPDGRLREGSQLHSARGGRIVPTVLEIRSANKRVGAKPFDDPGAVTERDGEESDSWAAPRIH